jgi:hypothetical protein
VGDRSVLDFIRGYQNSGRMNFGCQRNVETARLCSAMPVRPTGHSVLAQFHFPVTALVKPGTASLFAFRSEISSESPAFQSASRTPRLKKLHPRASLHQHNIGGAPRTTIQAENSAEYTVNGNRAER